MKLIRQGDVLLVPSNLPKGAKESEKRSDGRVILAFGEMTGHCHQIQEVTKVRMWDSGAERFLQVLEKATLVHDEHHAIELDPGIYKLPTQYEYEPQELRQVRD